jgi:hypothetical protein
VKKNRDLSSSIMPHANAQSLQTAARKCVAHHAGREIFLKRVDFGSRSIAALEVAVQVGAVQRNCNYGDKKAAKA